MRGIMNPRSTTSADLQDEQPMGLLFQENGFGELTWLRAEG
jgi:hypothetical protein